MSLRQAWEMMLSKQFPPKDTKPSFAGRNVIVTGANVGLGLEAAVKFVQQGATQVILGVRSLSKGEAAKDQIEARTGRKGCVSVWQLDMLNYDNVRAFASRADKELQHLDIAVLNAGVMAVTYEKSQYGWERTLQVNLLSTTLLSLLLLPKLQKSKTASFTPVLELVGSGNHYLLDKIIPEARNAESALEVYNRPDVFDFFTQYNVSKLFLMYAQTGLVNHLKAHYKDAHAVNVVVVCPGATHTELARDFTVWYLKLMGMIFQLLMAKTAEQGARTYISGVTVGDKGSGGFWTNDRVKAPAPLLVGDENRAFEEKIWSDITATLKQDVPEVGPILAA